MSSGNNIRVNSANQVECMPNFAESRSILGQERAVEHLSNELSSLSLRKQSKGIRPPLVGQASSSSNDSVSNSFEARTLNTCDRFMPSPPQNSETKGHYSSDHLQTPCLPNRNEYLNKKPPEGGSCSSVSQSQPIDGNLDLTRVRSSSSASSVMSSRPLEWDNGADVGYNQCHNLNEKFSDDNMSTIERMALIGSTDLLRSDPEGTCHQKVTLVKSKKLNKFCRPDAESTPLGIYITSPETVDLISPIPYGRKEDTNPGINSPDKEQCVQEFFNPISNAIQNQPATVTFKGKVPLFPEISLGHSVSNDKDKFQSIICLDENFSKHAESIERKHASENSSEVFNDVKQKLQSTENIHSPLNKLSSSLENLSSLNISPSCNKVTPYTLPRSQSQTDLCLENLSQENITNKTGLKSNTPLIQNLFKNKSASSSSVATVVPRKGESPKHALVQTSIIQKQSFGTQVCEIITGDSIKSKQFEQGKKPTDFPRLQHLSKTSNYFDFNCDVNKNTIASVNQQSGGNDYEDKKIMSSNVVAHFHEGIICRGAHKKVVVSNELPSQFNNINFGRSSKGDIDTNVSTPFTNCNKLVSSDNLIQKKIIGGCINDSVESSVKSGGCGTDKQYSVTVEDRVNSFEYLPGHIYEKNERQQPIHSCGTSSMSIENQTYNDATPESQNRVWESSGCGSISSTFEREAQRGVDILSDFVRGTYDNDSLLKKKLIRRVIDKLISKNHTDKRIESFQDLMKNTPWVPPRPPNPIERNAIKTLKSKVPCEFSSHSDKSGNTNTSSECFIPKPANRSTGGGAVLSSFFKDTFCQKFSDQGDHSSTSNLTPENIAKPLSTTPKLTKFSLSKTQETRENHNPKANRDFSSKKVLRTNNWKDPATKTEKIIEERRKIQSESSSNCSSVTQLLDMERENQLLWIRSEIKHLSNLRVLLERQEELKHGLKHSKSVNSRHPERNLLRGVNRNEKYKSHTVPSHMDAVSKKPPLKTKNSQCSKVHKQLNEFKGTSKMHDTDVDGWASHHYENEQNIKSCLKRNKNHKIKSTIVDKDYILYDETPSPFQSREHDLKRPNKNTTEDSESATMDENDYYRRSGSNNSRPPKLVKRPKQACSEPEPCCECPCEGKCKCCVKKTTKKERKAPVSYYIIFDNPQKIDESSMGKGGEKEIELSMPIKQKEKSARQCTVERQRAGADDVSKRTVSHKEEDNGLRPATEHTYNENNNDTKNSESKNPIFKGRAGELQYHLLHNRPSYVSRAEDRRQCIAQMQYLRELSNQNKQRLLSLTQSHIPPPPAMKVRRIFSQHKMRQMTENKYRQLSEVRRKLQDTKKKEGYRTNRLMAEIFKKNLQKRVLRGEVNLSNSICVISSV